MSRACCDRRDCPWPSRPLRSCTRPPWSCRTTDPKDSGRPSTLSSPTPYPVRRRAPPPGSRGVPSKPSAPGVPEGESVRPPVELAQALPLVLTPAPHRPRQHRHSNFRQPPRRWPPCRFHRVRYKSRARHAAKSFRPCRLPDYSCQQIHSHLEGAATPPTPDRTSRKHTFEFSLSHPHFLNRAGTAAPAPRARR
jgi:hypothetical protein